MKFLFVLMEIPRRFLMAPHFAQGLGSLSALLKQEGHQTDLLRVGDIVPDKIARKLRDFDPDIIGISSSSCFAGKLPNVVEQLRQGFNGPILLGGVHATVAPEEAIEIPGLMGIVRGEGEMPLLEFIDCIKSGADHTKIANFWFRDGDRILRNDIRPRIEDLDSLPFPDRDIFDYHNLLAENPVAEFMFSRGCPFQCAHCINAEWNRLYRGKGKVVRYRSVDNAIAEIKQVAERYPEMKQIEFHDDTLTINKDWLKDLCTRYAKEIGLPFACNVRPGTVDEETARMLKEANCTEVRMGIEAGNDFIRKKILKRNLSKEDIIRDFKTFKKVGIRTWAFNMIGMPYETPLTIEETILLNRLADADFAQVSVFTPFPGTETRTLCEEMGWLSDRSMETYFQNESPLDQPGLTLEQVAYYNRIFRWRVMYPRLAPLVGLLCRIPIGRKKVVYDLIFPLIKKLYRLIKYHRDVGENAAAQPHCEGT
ncbi:MAG: radical SAM protein [Planctomycetes bacterium]|nr:radical SAM protein [Planctomycetota bacterium]